MAETNSCISIERLGDIALIAIDNPPVNAASRDVRKGLLEAIEALSNDPKLKAIGLYGRGRTFVAGADIREFGKPPQPPSLPEVCEALEHCLVPVVAILHGNALGGGLELAISCQARIGITGLKVGFPEVSLGLIPGAGGTQRAPRLAGVKFASQLITSGKPLTAEKALAAGLIDEIADGAPSAVAKTFARKLADRSLPYRRTHELAVEADDEAIGSLRQSLLSSPPVLQAPLKALDAIEYADMPLSEGLAAERRIFTNVLKSDERSALVHAFFAERAVAQIPEAEATAQDISQVGIIGGGTMGSGIATSLLMAGLAVTLIEMSEDRLEFARSSIEKNLQGGLKRGKLTSDQFDNALSALTLSTNYDSLRDADLVVEAVFEDIEVKKQVFAKLDAVCKPGCILATNTSYLDVDAIAASTSRPGDVIGFHFFSPAHVMRLLEVVVAKKTRPDVVATGFKLGKRLRKVAVRSEICDGFIGNRILSHYRKAADYLMLDGASPAQIDHALEKFGFAMGPFAVADLAGLDIGWATRKRLAPTRSPDERYVGIADRLCEQGWFGRKSGQGYYRYDGGAKSLNPSVAEFIAAEQAQESISPRNYSDEDIVARYMTAMVIEAARVVEDKIALRPIDVDAVLLFGYGFPRHRGGPLHYADQIGLDQIVKRIEAYASEDAFYWQVPTILKQMADTGATFSDLN